MSYDTIIIGAGISGLACAKNLTKHDNDFILISKDIGGRILTSEDDSANYGAFFVCSDYKNVMPYITIKSRIKLSDFCFHENNHNYVLYEPHLLFYLNQFRRMKKILYKFRKSLRQLRKNTETISQKTAVEKNPLLHELYMKDAVDFVKENNLEKGNDKYLSKALYSTTFSSVNEMNAFSYLQFLLPLITPIYTFTFKKEKMISDFKEKIFLETVNNVSYKNNKYKIKTNGNIFYSKKLVLATEISWSQQITGVKEINKSVSTNMIHVRGSAKKSFERKRYHLFTPPSNVQAIADLLDGTYLFYYKNKKPSLKYYFNIPEVISRHSWNPAGRINGHNLIESNRGNNMYLIGDYNIAGLEESYITGLYASNQIIKS
jgi:hypothetical protein